MKDSLKKYIGNFETINKILEDEEKIVYHTEKRNGYGIVEYRDKNSPIKYNKDVERKYHPEKHPRPDGWD